MLVGAVAAALLVTLTTLSTSALEARADDAVAPQASSAASGQVAWSMVPVITDIGEERSNFAYALEPGDIVDDAVLVRNSGSTALDLAVHGSDAFTDAAGALDIAAESAADGIGSWVVPAVNGVHVEPGELVRIPFSVTVPADALPGEHAGALLTVLGSDGETVSVDMRYATRVTVSVAGDLTAGLSLGEAALGMTTGFWPWEAASADVSYAVRNTGNTRVAAMQLITAGGVELYSTPDASNGFASLTELLPDAAVDVRTTVDGLTAWWPFTTVDVAVSPTVLTVAGVEAPRLDQHTLTLSAVTIAPGWWVILAGALLAALLAVRSVRRRRRAPAA